MNTDPKFPQLAKALNPELMGPLLSRALNPADKQSAGAHCRIGEKRYKPGNSPLISYWLQRPDKVRHQASHATGRLCQPGQARSEFEREIAKRPELAEGGLRYLHDPAMLLWLFPYDRKLKHLPTLSDPVLLRPRLQPMLKVLGVHASASLISLETELLHYLPERSCMLRYRIGYSVPGSEAVNTVCLYGKHYPDQAGAETFNVMRQLSKQFSSGAQALAYDSELCTLWQSHLPGAPLSWADMVSDKGFVLAERMGLCVAQLHASRIETLARVTTKDVERGLLDTVEIAERVLPALRGDIQSAVDELLALNPAGSGSQLASLHHDLKLNNFLWDTNSLGLIDMDCVCLGDPLIDLASLIANLYLYGLREGETAERIHPLANYLVSAYRRNSGYAVSWTDLRWQIAAALIHEVIRRSLRQLDSGRMAHLRAYLELSHCYAALSRTAEQGDELVS